MKILESGAIAVFPVLAGFRKRGVEPPAGGFLRVVGTAFCINDSRTMLSAQHVFDETPEGLSLTDGPEYRHIGWSIGVEGESGVSLFQIGEHQDCGNDICLLNVADVDVTGTKRLVVPTPFKIASEHASPAGSRVSWSGFSLSVENIIVDDLNLDVLSASLWVHARMHRGHITTRYKAPPPYAPGLHVPAYELDQPVFPGASGGPVWCSRTGMAIGMLSKGLVINVQVSGPGGSVEAVRHAVGLAVDITGSDFSSGK